MSNRLFTFVTVKILPVGIANIGWRLYIIWTVFNAAQTVFTIFFVPETRGKTLEEIDYIFSQMSALDVQAMVRGEKPSPEQEHIESSKHRG